MKILRSLLLTWLGFTVSTPAADTNEGRFESLGIPVRAGGLMGCLAGPNGRGGEALYFNFNQTSGKLFLVQVDPDTGAARQFNAPEGPGAWAFIVGPDEKLYLGTWESGWLLRFDPKHPEKGIENLGKPAQSESYLWQFDIGNDGKLYACTYPGAKLVSYDPATGRMQDLGRMHPTEMYSRSVAVGPNGKVYVGIGTELGDLVVFDPATGQHRSILPPELRKGGGFTASVVKAADGQVYASCHGEWFKFADETLERVDHVPKTPEPKLRDGRILVESGRGLFTLRDPRSGRTVECRFDYTTSGDPLFLVGVGPSNCVYGSTVLPMEIFRYDPVANRSEHLGAMANGEVYSMLEHRGKLYLCYYPGAIMNLYDPASPPWKHGPGPNCNPISFGGVGDGHLRPRAMIGGPDGFIYIGSEPPYGQQGGAIGVWDPQKNKTIENYRHVITNQAVVSLAWEPKSGLIFGGSGNWGGGGTRPVGKEAKFFAFDPKRKKKVFEATLVPDAGSYPATFAADGKVFTTVGSKLFVFDPQQMKVVKTLSLPGPQVQISLGRHASDRLVGLAGNAVYVLDPVKDEILFTAKSPTHINCGFALTTDAVYFGSGPALWRYLLPKLAAATPKQTDKP